MPKLLFFFLLFASHAFGQTLTISGTVVDADSGQPIPYANIFAQAVGTTSDEDGKYEFSVQWDDEVVISCSFLGYESSENNILAAQNAKVTLDFALALSDNLLETAVVTSGRFEKKLGKTTVSLAVLKPKLLESTNTITVDDALNRISGVDVIDGQANIRGGSGYSYGAGSRVLLLLDGMPIMQTDAAFPNWNDMPIENVGQIEILKGAASALYGSSAMNGIVNIRTAVPNAKPYLRVAPFYTTYLSPKDKSQKWWDKSPYGAGLSAVYRQRLGKLGLSLGGFYLSEEGFKKGTYKKYGRGFVGLDYRFSERVEAGFHTYYNPGSTATFFFWNDDTTGIYQPAPNTISSSKRTRINVDPYVKIFDGFGNIHKIQGRYLSANNKNNEGQGVKSTMLFAEYQYLRKFKKIGLTATSGLATTGSYVSAELYGDTTYTARNNAIYLQLEKTIKSLTLSGGVRYESNVLRSPEVIPTTILGVTTYDTIPDGLTKESKPVFRAGLNWQLGKATYLRVSYGQGYRYPTIAEKFISTEFGGGIPIMPNATLVSESGNSFEVGIKQGFQFERVKGFVDLSYFISRYEDMMEFAFGGRDGSTLGFASINIGDTRIPGIEFILAGKARIGAVDNQFMGGIMQISPQYVDFTKRLQDASSSDKNILKYRFKNSWKLDWESSYQKMAVGLSLIHNGPTEAVDAILEDFIKGAKRFRANHNGFTRFDLRTSWAFSPKYKVSVIGQNVTNEAYSQRVGKLEAPFNISFRLDMLLL